jgi:hypothetical protein
MDGHWGLRFIPGVVGRSSVGTELLQRQEGCVVPYLQMRL